VGAHRERFDGGLQAEAGFLARAAIEHDGRRGHLIVWRAGRLHRTESYYEDSYGVLSIVSVGWRLH
jgi:hypothetical protein